MCNPGIPSQNCDACSDWSDWSNSTSNCGTRTRDCPSSTGCAETETKSCRDDDDEETSLCLGLIQECEKGKDCSEATGSKDNCKTSVLAYILIGFFGFMVVMKMLGGKT
jgi:hypothetical protein